MQNVSTIIEMHGIILSLLAIIYLITSKRSMIDEERGVCLVLSINSIILFTDILSTLCEGHTSLAVWWITRIACCIMYVSQYLLLIIISIFLFRVIQNAGGKRETLFLGTIHIICTMVIGTTFVNLFLGKLYWFDEQNVYHRGPWFLFVMIASGIALVLSAVTVLRYRKKLHTAEFLSFFALSLLPLCGVILQILTKSGAYTNIFLTAGAAIVAINVLYQVRRQMAELESKVLQNRVYLLNSQIKPHFLFNTLAVIRALIDEDQETAKEAVNHLSRFLRQGMDVDSGDKPVTIEEELSYIEHYLYIEKLRFGDSLNIVYEVDPNVHFRLPFLSVQPLVENAVKHGIKQKEEGGTLTIRVYQQKNYNVVEVFDDGAGFDEEAFRERKKQQRLENSDNGIGTDNVEQRLFLMCKGKLEITSEPGKGTTAKVSIPIN